MLLPTTWSLSKTEEASIKAQIFNDLYVECKLAAPGARLSCMIRNKLEKWNRKERKDIVSRIKDGCSPLFIGCKKGNVEVVEFLIVECDADVEQRGMYEVPDDRSLHFVTPLWCASVAGKLPVVRCLVAHGAKVNTVSDTGSTPVRSACFMTHLEVVTFLVENGADISKPNHNGGTCLINSVQSVNLCSFLLSHGAEVNAQDIQFKTALHYAITEHRSETMLLLLKYGADPYVKSRYGDDALQTACMKGATEIVKYLLDNLEYSQERWAEAHELLGAAFCDEHHDLQMALQCWRQALAIRYRDPNQSLKKKFYSTDEGCEGYQVPKAAFLYQREFETLEELENLSYDLDAMHMQSLLITERIIGPLHKDMIFRLMYRGAAYADSMQHQRCVDLWKYALELRVAKDTLLHGEAWFTATTLVKLFFDLHNKYSSGYQEEQVQYKDIVDIIVLLVEQFPQCVSLLSVQPQFKRQQDNFDKILKVLAHLIYILNALPKDAAQTLESKRLVHRVLRVNPLTAQGDSLLHLAVSKASCIKSASFFEETSQNEVFPSTDMARLLLECGANVEATNQNHSTALHIASMRLNYHPELVELLLAHGCHIDQRNSNGNQPHRMLTSIIECNLNPLKHLTLKCFAARKIVERRIPYCGEVPASLEEFIHIH